jgi:hypothetical protein
MPSGGTVLYVAPTGDDAQNGTSWNQAKRTLRGAVDAAGGAGGGEVWVAAGSYRERVTVRPNVHLYGGFAGGDAVGDDPGAGGDDQQDDDGADDLAGEERRFGCFERVCHCST